MSHKTFDGCIECWEEFRYDDTGGYNPPCFCGFHCRDCHDRIKSEEDDYERPEDSYPPEDASPASASLHSTEER